MLAAVNFAASMGLIQTPMDAVSVVVQEIEVVTPKQLEPLHMWL